jgi:hypothetical protein
MMGKGWRIKMNSMGKKTEEQEKSEKPNTKVVGQGLWKPFPKPKDLEEEDPFRDEDDD